MRASVFILSLAMLAGCDTRLFQTPCPRTVWRGAAITLIKLSNATVTTKGNIPPSLQPGEQAVTIATKLIYLKTTATAIYNAFKAGCVVVSGSPVVPDDDSPLLVTSYLDRPNSTSAGTYYLVTDSLTGDFFIYAEGDVGCFAAEPGKPH